MTHLIHAALFWALILLIALDAADTYMIVHHGGQERNKWGMQQMIAKMGLIPALLFSHGFLIALIAYFRDLLSARELTVFVIAFALIAYHNLVSWIRAGHGS